MRLAVLVYCVKCESANEEASEECHKCGHELKSKKNRRWLTRKEQSRETRAVLSVAAALLAVYFVAHSMTAAPLVFPIVSAIYAVACLWYILK